MSFMQKIRETISRFMVGRHGPDNLGMATLGAGIVLYLLGMILRSGVLSTLALAMYVVTVFRMLSRNTQARIGENRKYLELTGKWKLEGTRFVRRMKNRKEYKYFRCPQCKQLLRLKRGCGEKDITCAKCGHQFKQKA